MNRLPPHALLAGWFSFEDMGATAGDLISAEAAKEWLAEGGLTWDVAYASPFTGGVNWRSVDPDHYGYVVFVCGPFGNGPPVVEFLERFAGRRMLGLNLSMLDPLESWNPFDLLIERDSSRRGHPDLSLLSTSSSVPVVGLIQIHPQPEYGERDKQLEANSALERLLECKEVSVVRIDTRLDVNATGLRTPNEIESLIGRMDIVLTTRLHGMVLSIKNGVPPLVIDPVAGGAKITRQARELGWPIVFDSSVKSRELEQAYEFCLTPDAAELARNCSENAISRLIEARVEFHSAVRTLSASNGELK